MRRLGGNTRITRCAPRRRRTQSGGGRSWHRTPPVLSPVRQGIGDAPAEVTHSGLARTASMTLVARLHRSATEGRLGLVKGGLSVLSGLVWSSPRYA
jgi:hypothetical protein